ncbi:hypothetical protein ACQPZP_41400 [Spirillospora sp. CA-142024]|uniref:hypothetical protein n=1 Tax=Spirillospora sp. CA-142024 TaxID=3240036 RepID=UPI003D94D9F0
MRATEVGQERGVLTRGLLQRRVGQRGSVLGDVVGQPGQVDGAGLDEEPKPAPTRRPSPSGSPRPTPNEPPPKHNSRQPKASIRTS